MGWAFSGGIANGDFGAFGFAAGPVPVDAAGAALFLSLAAGLAIGVGEVKVLDCAHAAGTRSKTIATANARRFIVWKSLPGSSQDRNKYLHDKDAGNVAGVNLEVLEINLTAYWDDRNIY